MFRATEGRWGSREVEITDVTFYAADGERGHVFHSGDRLDVRIRLRAPLPIDDFVLRHRPLQRRRGLLLRHQHQHRGAERSERAARATPRSAFTIESLDLVEGTYKLDVAIHKVDGYPYDYHRLLYTFRVKSRTKDVGIYRPRHQWRFSDGMTLTREDGGA